MRSINRGMAKLLQISLRYRGPIIHRCITMFGSSLVVISQSVGSFTGRLPMVES